MKSKAYLRKHEIVFICGTILFALFCLGAIGAAGRERAKRAVCLNNLKRLTLAWDGYACDNDERIVNGAPMGTEGYADPGTWIHEGEIPWVGRCYHSEYASGQRMTEFQKKQAVKRGLLWPYCGDLRLYECPARYPGEVLNYSIVDGMNGLARTGASKRGVFIKNRQDIRQPAARAVFIDEGWITPDSFAVHYNRREWWDGPPGHHADGATLSFADGHAEYWKWQSGWTIELARLGVSRSIRHQKPPWNDVQALFDLQRVQIAIWGGLGY